jgi:hypothetical protein
MPVLPGVELPAGRKRGELRRKIDPTVRRHGSISVGGWGRLPRRVPVAGAVPVGGCDRLQEDVT